MGIFDLPHFLKPMPKLTQPDLQRLADAFTNAVHKKIDMEAHFERVKALSQAPDYDAFINVCITVFAQGMDKTSFAAFMANTILVGYDMAAEEGELKRAVPDLNFLEQMAALIDPREDIRHDGSK